MSADFAEVPLKAQAQQPIGIGHNRAPVAELLRDAYRTLSERYAALIASFGRAPASIDDDEALKKVSDLAAMLAACGKHLDAAREQEKAPFLAAGREVDGFFKPMLDGLADAKTALSRRATHYMNRKAEAERKAREEEARIAQAEADRKLREAQEAEAHKLSDVADTKLAEAAEAEIDANIAAKAATAKPAELARTRSDAGTVATLSRKWEFAVDDWSKLDLETLRPYIAQGDLEKAVRAFVRTHKNTKPLAGVRIFEGASASFR